MEQAFMGGDALKIEGTSKSIKNINRSQAKPRAIKINLKTCSLISSSLLNRIRRNADKTPGEVLLAGHCWVQR